MSKIELGREIEVEYMDWGAICIEMVFQAINK